MLLYRDGVFAIASQIRARLCSGAAQITFCKMPICSMAWLWVMLVRPCRLTKMKSAAPPSPHVRQGWEDLNNHSQLRHDIAYQTAVGGDDDVKLCPAGTARLLEVPPPFRQYERTYVCRIEAVLPVNSPLSQ
ncbi:MAG: hypothetical protein ACK5RJ_07880 [Burkholderiales bacterium]